MRPGPGRPTAVALWAVLCVACGTTREAWTPSWDAPYSTFDDALRADFAVALEHFEAGRWEAAWSLLDPLAREHRDNIAVGLWLQETELALLTAGSTVSPVLAALEGDGDPLSKLRPENPRPQGLYRTAGNPFGGKSAWKSQQRDHAGARQGYS